jgi:hypothetical protein
MSLLPVSRPLGSIVVIVPVVSIVKPTTSLGVDMVVVLVVVAVVVVVVVVVVLVLVVGGKVFPGARPTSYP